MARLPAEFKKGLFDWISDSVEAGTYPSILEAIKAQTLAQAPVVRGGQTVLSASGNGYSTTFAIPGSYSPQELFSFWTELRDIYNDALSTLSANSLSATHDNVRDTMRADDRLQTVTRTHGDYTLLRCPAGGYR